MSARCAAQVLSTSASAARVAAALRAVVPAVEDAGGRGREHSFKLPDEAHPRSVNGFLTHGFLKGIRR